MLLLILAKWTKSAPARLRIALAAGWMLSGALCLVVLLGWAQHQHAVQTLGIDAAPSVLAAHTIKIHIESLDADLVNELLSSKSAQERGAEPAGYIADFDKNRVEIGEQIVAASKNITFGEAEQGPLKQIQESLGRYLMAVQAARDAHARDDLATMLENYRASLAILEEKLVPGANALNAVNDGVLQATYEAQKSASTWSVALAIIVGGALALLLVATQLYLRIHFRRRINPALAFATVLQLAFVGYTVESFLANARDLKGVKEDSYDSVAALLGARADAYEANAAESRWLLDPAMRAGHEHTFVAFTRKLVSFSKGQTFEKAHAIAVARNATMRTRIGKGDLPAIASLRARADLPLAGMDGELKQALDNITFPDADPLKDEPTQSAETLRRFGVYYGVDGHIRELERSGRHAEAVRSCLSMKEGDSNWAFFQFDESLGRWLQLNQAWMHRYEQAAFADIAGLRVAAPLVSLFVAVLVFLGLRPRMREYTF